MKKKNTDKVYLEFIGHNAKGVTGSCIYGKFFDNSLNRNFQFLLELGMKQDGSPLDCYRGNMATLEKINAKELDAVFVLDNHADHSMLVPALIQKGFSGRVYLNEEKTHILPIMWEDGVSVNKSDVKGLIKKGVKAKPYYGLEEIGVIQTMFEVVPFNERVFITENISIEFRHNMHNLGSASLVLWCRDKHNNVHKLFYSSDLGNVRFKKSFIEQEQEPISHANVCIYESTYGSKAQLVVDHELRNKEVKELHKMLRYTLLEKKGICLMPAFSFDRTPNLLLVLKEIMDNDPDLKHIPVTVTGKLTNRLLDCFYKICKDKNKEDIDEILKWDNITRVASFEKVEQVLVDRKPQIILASSGFCTNGYVVYFLERLLGHKENTIVFSGYSSPGSPASKIKESHLYPESEILIGESKIIPKSDILTMHSFSSHIMREDLIEFITATNHEKCVLVHGEHREHFANDLRKIFANKCKSTKVIVPYVGDTIIF